MDFRNECQTTELIHRRSNLLGGPWVKHLLQDLIVDLRDYFLLKSHECVFHRLAEGKHTYPEPPPILSAVFAPSDIDTEKRK